MSHFFFAIDRPSDDAVAALTRDIEQAGGSATNVTSSGSSGLQIAQLIVEAAGPAVAGVAAVLAAWIGATKRDAAASERTSNEASSEVVIVAPDGREIRCPANDHGAIQAILESIADRPTSTPSRDAAPNCT